jgi:hypothetical protein
MRFGHHIQCEVIAMPINRPEHSYNCGRGHTERSVKQRDATATVATVLRKSAIQIPRFLPLYHAIASSHCCGDQPIALLFAAMLSVIKLVLSLCYQRNRPDQRITKGNSLYACTLGSRISKTDRDRSGGILDKAPLKSQVGSKIRTTVQPCDLYW